MTSESLRIEHDYPRHRNRYVPRVCPQCGAPETSDGTCTHCLSEPPAAGVTGAGGGEASLAKMVAMLMSPVIA
jgi:hypothetical protein